MNRPCRAGCSHATRPHRRTYLQGPEAFDMTGHRAVAINCMMAICGRGSGAPTPVIEVPVEAAFHRDYEVLFAGASTLA